MFLSLRVHFAEFGPIPTKFFVDDRWVVASVVDTLQGGVRLLTPLYKYVRRESNDPPIITKNIPARINKRLSSRPFHRTKHRSTKLLLHTKKYSTRTDATTSTARAIYNSQTQKQRKQRNNILSCTTLHSAKTSTPISVTDSSP